jgi:glycosyltransferase involved in cell wall biosynthesis
VDESGPWLTVLIPAYNEEAGLASSVEQVLDALTRHGVSAEILIVDDASTDATGRNADALAVREPAVRVVHHPENRNIGGVMRTGIAAARGAWLILIPADLAMDLDELSKYIVAAQVADVVVGVCSDRSDYSMFRRLVSWANIQAIRVLFRMPLRQYNYISMYRTEVLNRIDVEYVCSAFFFAEILIKARDLGARLVEVDVAYVPRASGKATGATPRLIWRTSRDMIRFWGRRIGLARHNT